MAGTPARPTCCGRPSTGGSARTRSRAGDPLPGGDPHPTRYREGADRIALGLGRATLSLTDVRVPPTPGLAGTYRRGDKAREADGDLMSGSTTLRPPSSPGVAVPAGSASHQAPHPRTLGWVGTTALAMGGSNQSLFLLGALLVAQGTAAIPLLAVGLLLALAAMPG